MLNNIEHERQVIGAILDDPNVAYHECIRQGVTEDTFFDTTCRQIWNKCRELENIKQATDLPGILHRSQEEDTSRLSGEATNMRNKLVCLDYGLSCISKIVGYQSTRVAHKELQLTLAEMESGKSDKRFKKILKLEWKFQN